MEAGAAMPSSPNGCGGYHGGVGGVSLRFQETVETAQTVAGEAA
jgi:hypothetical protein